MTRDERQNIIINNWLRSKGWGIALAFSGFGKSRTILKSIGHLHVNDVTVVVPTLYLKEQWEGHLKHIEELDIKCQVLVVNTACKMEFYTDYLIVDELHLALSEEFGKVLTNIKSKYFFGTTATILENEKWSKALDKAPIVDEVTIEEGITNGWIATHNVYTIPITLNKEEQLLYDKATAKFDFQGEKLKKWGNPMKVAKDWLMFINIKKNLDKYKIHIKSGKLYSIKYITSEYERCNMEIEWFKFRELNVDEIDLYFKRAMTAKNYYAAIRERKQIISKASNKIPVINHLLDTHSKDKTIVFGEAIDFLSKLNHNNCFYHSKLTTKQKKTNIDNFITDKVNTIFSCKALNTGVDIAGVNVGIITSFNSSSITATQVIGRSTRKEGDKISYIYYVYVKDTQDEVWLNNALKNIKYEEKRYV